MRPDDWDLEQAIAAAFDRLPDPNSTKFKEIEERLIRASRAQRAPARRRWTYWWLIAALGATAAAAWWVGDYVSREPASVSAARRIGVEPVPQVEPREDERVRPAAPGATRSERPEIYRRERY